MFVETVDLGINRLILRRFIYIFIGLFGANCIYEMYKIRRVWQLQPKNVQGPVFQQCILSHVGL